MEALKGVMSLLLILVAILAVVALIVLLWPWIILISVVTAVLVVGLQIIKILVNGRLR